MKAVYTEYPYKYWMCGPIGEMFLFNDDEEAAGFADSRGYFLCDNPNMPEEAFTWTRLAWSYLTCGGTIRIEGSQPKTWDTIFMSKQDNVKYTFDEFENRLFDVYDMPCVECWVCDGETGWKDVNTGLTYEECYED